MEKLQFKCSINAPAEKVWKVLFGETTYPQWTSVFCEGSMVETNWQKGSKALFLDGKGSGMASEIAENISNQFMSIRHLGEVKNGVEDYSSEEVQKWSGAMENYTLNENDGKTELVIDMDCNADFKDYLLKTWPPALEKVQELAEQDH